MDTFAKIDAPFAAAIKSPVILNASVVEACERGDAAALEIAIALGGDPGASNALGQSALGLAARGDHLRCAQILLPLCQPAERDGLGMTPLMWAASNGSRRVVSCLLRHSDPGVQMLSKGRLGALAMARRGGHAECASLLANPPAKALPEEFAKELAQTAAEIDLLTVASVRKPQAALREALARSREALAQALGEAESELSEALVNSEGAALDDIAKEWEAIQSARLRHFEEPSMANLAAQVDAALALLSRALAANYSAPPPLKGMAGAAREVREALDNTRDASLSRAARCPGE